MRCILYIFFFNIPKLDDLMVMVVKLKGHTHSQSAEASTPCPVVVATTLVMMKNDEVIRVDDLIT